MTDRDAREAVRADTVPPHGFRRARPGELVTGWQVTGEAHELTEAQLDELAARWRKANSGRNRNRLVLLTPLPWRTRVRLACESASNHLGCWLVERGWIRAARTLWRIK